MIRIKRAYEQSVAGDGARFLVDGLWPRGVKKEALQIQAWVRDAAPSAPLRKWFGHDPKKWHDFQRRYVAELDKKPESWATLLDAARKQDVTLLYGAHDEEHNHAVVLKSYLDRHLKIKAHHEQ